MAQLRLSEYETLRDVALTLEEVAALRTGNAAETGAVAVAPSTKSGYYDLTASSWVGVVNAGTLTLEIQPKIPIDRLLFLLSYRLDPRRWRDIPFDYDERSSLLEAVIPGFVFQVRRALRRGPLQGYRVKEETLSIVRGRIRFADQVRRHFGIAPPIEVQYHEFTEDILENRFIKAAIVRLGRLRIRSAESRRLLQEFDQALERVTLVPFDARAVPEVGYTRLNEHYRPAVELARLILRATSFELAAGGVRSASFLVDMNQVFEDFVVTALREALGVSDRIFPQGAGGHSLYLDEEHALRLEPDISWWDQGRCVFVGDVKYKRLATAAGQNSDVYQLLAYTVAAHLPGGLLIYARGEAQPALHRVVHAGKELQVVALDLNGEPETLLAQIDAIAARIRNLARAGRHARLLAEGQNSPRDELLV